MSRNQKLNATITIGSALSSTVGRHLNVVRKGMKNVGDEITRVTARQREIAKQREVLVKQGQAVDHLDHEYAQLGRTLERLNRQQERYVRASAAANRVGRDFGRMNTEISRTARTASIAIGAVAGASFGLASSTAAAGNDISEWSRLLGIGTRELQELRYAAQRAGISSGVLDTALRRMLRRVAEAAKGTGAAKNALEELGLEADRLNLNTPEQQLEMITQAMQAIDSQSDRMRLAMAIFDTEGVPMVRMMEDGVEGLRAMREEAEGAGYILSPEAIENAVKFSDALDDAKTIVTGLRHTIGAELMPVVTEAMGKFSDFMRSNRDSVKEFAETAADGLERAIPIALELASGMATVGQRVGEVIAKVAEMVGGWENLGAIVGTALSAKVLVSVGAFALSAGKLAVALGAIAAPAVAAGIRAVGAALTMNPIGATVMLIAGAALLIVQNWDKIRPALQPVIDWMGEAFDWVWKKLEPVRDALKWVADKGTSVARGLGFGGRNDPDAATAAEEEAAVQNVIRGPAVAVPDDLLPPPVQERAIGGAYSPGALLVGERGPELRYESQGGFIAHHRALERLARLAERAGGIAGGTQVTAPITINAAPGQNPREIAREVLRELQNIQRGALYDRGIA